MELVRFYACDGDPLRVALKLALKAHAQRQRARILGPAEALQRLSQQLWQQDGFIAHAGPGASPAQQARSALVLSEQAQGDEPLLINLGQALPDTLGAQRLFELVGPQPEQREAGRERYRRHQQLGRPLETVRL